jgi:hypothetical protein
MPPYDSRRTDAHRESRALEPRRRRAKTGVVIIDDDISWSTVARRPRRISGPVSGESAREASDAYEDPSDPFVNGTYGRRERDQDEVIVVDAEPSDWTPSSYASGNGERRTVVITGRVADRYAPVRRGGYESGLRRHERSNFRPDRVAMWAVLLGVLLVLIAATSSHAATLAAHLPH